jgi:hypothetical protein
MSIRLQSPRTRNHTAAVCLLIFTIAGFAQTPSTIADQFTTPERVEKSKWWPTMGKAPRSDYVGPKGCQECHLAIVKSQGQHSMAKASVPAANSDVLREHASRGFRVDNYDYKIVADANGAFSYTVSDSNKVTNGPITWAFGAGKVGQSYLSEQNGNFHEIRFSYFETLHSFGVTPNQSPQSATSISKATGRILSGEEAERCFGCHTTASKVSNHFEPANALAGVTCEGCHGPGAKHATAMKGGDLDGGLAAILNPRDLKPVDSIDFCGACHTTWWDAKRIAATGIANVRFQPYRLESSRCWKKEDARLACVGCHNPHQPLVRDSEAYDNRCLSCHSASGAKPTAEHPESACPVAKQDCVSCHMPKYEVPDMHFKYTDHRIRIVKAGDAFPD